MLTNQEKVETTFERFIASDPVEKAKFDKEYSEFLFSEFILETMESEHLTVRTLAKKAGVSPTVIQKIRSKDAEKINLRTLRSVLGTLGYKIRLEKISDEKITVVI
jgi:hypothetical protein